MNFFIVSWSTPSTLIVSHFIVPTEARNWTRFLSGDHIFPVHLGKPQFDFKPLLHFHSKNIKVAQLLNDGTVDNLLQMPAVRTNGDESEKPVMSPRKRAKPGLAGPSRFLHFLRCSDWFFFLWVLVWFASSHARSWRRFLDHLGFVFMSPPTLLIRLLSFFF